MTKQEIKIKVLYLSYCPYTKKAFEFLENQNLKIEKQVIDEIKEELKIKHFYSTFPQIFINEKLIGGFTEISQLDKEGFFKTNNIDLIIDKIQLGKITKSNEYLLLAKNNIESNKLDKARELLNKSLKIYQDNLESEQILKQIQNE